MNRCIRYLIPYFAALLVAAPLLAGAQTGIGRQAPKDVKHGHMVITAPPGITLDGKADRLSPGARIRNTNSMLLLSGSAVGQNLPVVYRRDAAGLVSEVWVLTPEEDARLGGDDSSLGHQRFAELLDLIFGARR